ncbi:hypothetical protein [Roseiflexus castenholzii]|uniref:hypothetical protein n=1 Tax=Roseiflexus castenholzii TaxID=120962 RepID=UPI003C7C7D63
MASLNDDRAGALLAELYAEAEAADEKNQPPKAPPASGKTAEALFRSPAQSSREVLLGGQRRSPEGDRR